MGKEMVDQAIGPAWTVLNTEEQAWPLVCLGSPRLSYVGGEVLWTDGGWNGAMTMGRHEAQWADTAAVEMSKNA